MNSYFIPRALHLDSTVPNQPDFDTLIGISNPYDSAQTVAIHCFDTAGHPVPKSPLHWTLAPGHSVATTFITHNVFPDPPQNWQGYAKLEFSDKALPAMACLGGNGPSPLNWNYATPNIPLLGAHVMTLRGSHQRWVFPYAIPHFVDAAQHANEHEYRSAVSITNLGCHSALVHLTFTVGDVYPNAGQILSTDVTIAPGVTLVRQLHELLPELLGFNSEGWLDLRTDQPTDLAMVLFCANRDYNFLGWGQSPFALA